MSGNVFVADQVLLDVSFDAARRQLRRLAGEEAAVLTLAGVYRLPGEAGAGLDPAIVRCFADVSIRSFMARLACALTHPAGTAVPAGRAGPETQLP
jgi:hypothetical protein